MKRTDDDVLRLALELQERARSDLATREALGEVGVEPRFFEQARRLVEEREARRSRRLRGGLALLATAAMFGLAAVALGLLTPTPGVTRAGVALQAGPGGGALRESFSAAQAGEGLWLWAELQDLEADAVFGFEATWHSPAGEVGGTCEQSRNHAREARLAFWCRVVLREPVAPGDWRVTLGLTSRHTGRLALTQAGSDQPLEVRFRVTAGE